jgi:hypothetical protein
MIPSNCTSQDLEILFLYKGTGNMFACFTTGVLTETGSEYGIFV